MVDRLVHGLADRQNGCLTTAIRNFRKSRARISSRLASAVRLFRDYTAIDDLAQTLFERAKLERGPNGGPNVTRC